LRLSVTLVVEPDQDGFTCLDFSREMPDGERPVVYHFPFKKTPFHDYRQNYGEWSAESLRAMVEAWSDAED
jgi:lipopolysaccharide biosynthesis glycosyltransferase